MNFDLRERESSGTNKVIDISDPIFDTLIGGGILVIDNAINKGEHSRPKINCAWTNEAFELWYLLHFSYYNTGLSRHQYQKLIEKEIIKSSGKKGYKYTKNSRRKRIKEKSKHT